MTDPVLIGFETFLGSLLGNPVALQLGAAQGLSASTSALLSAAGSFAGLVLSAWLGGPAHRLMAQRFPHHDFRPGHQSPVGRLWNRYGVIGFGLSMPWTLGVLLAGLVGVTLGIRRRDLLTWGTMGTLMFQAAMWATV